jgi:hypothetical protein
VRAGLSTKAVSILTIVALVVLAAIQAHRFVFPDFSDAGRAISAVVFVVGAYESLLWRWIPLPGRPPRLRGTWEMTLTPQTGPKGMSRVERKCYLAISQTMLTIDADLFFDDGTSKVTAAMLVKERRKYQLLVFYDFEPKVATRAEPRRKGAAALDILGDGPTGKYWNDFGISGDLVATKRNSKICDSYPSAASGTYK